MNARTNKTVHGANYGKTYNRRNYAESTVVLHEKALADLYVFEGSERDVAIEAMRRCVDAKNRATATKALKSLATALKRHGTKNPAQRAKWMLRYLETREIVTLH